MMELQNIQPNKRYLLAVSGGVDSMVMADLFLKQSLSFAVAHCNFNLRGHESDQDEALVKLWCEQHKIQFFTTKFNTTQVATEQSISIQECARKLRYDYFFELLDTQDFDFVATAHHQNDTIETVCFHFFRGTGIQGLTGIPAQTQQVLRPMLHVWKKEILDYAAQHAIPYRNDRSNDKNDYARNNLRNRILPFIEESFPQLQSNIASNIKRMKDVNEIYHKAIEQISKKVIQQRGRDFYIPIRKLKTLHPIETICYELIKPFGFRFEQGVELIKLMDRQTGSYIQNQTHQIIRNREFFIITAKEPHASDMILIDEGTERVEGADFILQIKKIESKKIQPHVDANSECIDASELCYPLILRNWKQGDYLFPLGLNKKKKSKCWNPIKKLFGSPVFDSIIGFDYKRRQATYYN
jgi:tRNA(Ile)-lysidine synthase